MKSVEYFDSQFRRQVRDQEYALNPFETLALPHLRGSVLDLGCGLGNLALEAARRGHQVVAIDASPTAIARIRSAAGAEGLSIEALQADLGSRGIDRNCDTIVAIGLLMFFPRARALALLRDVQEHVRPGGRAIVNVLIEGTTFLEMFEPDRYCLFGPDELTASFAGWTVLASVRHGFPAPGGTRKEFSTLVAEKPG